MQANNRLYFVAKKVDNPAFDKDPTYGPLIKLRRVGKDGKIFKVYKLRTMYPYAEYLQDYVYKHNELDEGGKFKDDFRVSPLGRLLRKFWIDEFPMFWNLIKGDMKLIGVRPLSKHYFSLYTPEVQEMRTRVKPGLVPPFYADMPKTLDDIILSEKKYLELYAQNPLKTDISYFFKIFTNIFFRGARSK
jgi:lipopolysaccharide/colanic/teichoic acid biosynthesis glycosyltransferase